MKIEGIDLELIIYVDPENLFRVGKKAEMTNVG
jgi:hypothetical protein